MKILKYLFILIILLGSSSLFAQNISSSSPITLPQSPETKYKVDSGKKVTIISSKSVILLPGAHFRPGSDVTVKIGEVFNEERLPIVFADPGFAVSHDYSAWLNDDFNDLVQLPADDNNNKYIDVTLLFEKKAEVTKIALYDGLGSIANPVSVYTINAGVKTLIGTFNGTSDLSFVNFPVNPSLEATGLVIRKYGNDIPVKVQAYGRLLPDGIDRVPFSASITSKQDLTCFGSNNGKIDVTANGGNVVYEPFFDGELNVHGNKIYHYSLDGITFKKTGVFNNLSGGNYIVYVRDAFNITLQLPVQIIEPSQLTIAETITPINCYGNCSGAIALSVSGGTPPYTYSWQNHSSFGNNFVVSNLCSGVYEVMVTDAKGCTAQKSIELNDGDEIVLTQLSDKTLCSGQSLQLSAGNSGASYQWTANNGFSSNQQNVTVNLAGDYSLTVTNSKGCQKTATFNVQLKDYVFKAEFLASSIVNAGDTVIVVDITKPKPTTVNWTLPANVREVVSYNSGIKQLVFDNAGIYTISMQVSDGNCTDFISKTIDVRSQQAKLEVNSALGYQEELVKKLSLYPNPSSGQFTVGIELSQSANVKVSLIGLGNNQQIEQKLDTGKTSYELQFNHMELNSGIYLVTVEAGTIVKTLKFIKL